MKKYLTWDYFKRLMEVMQLLILFFGAVYTIDQLQEIKYIQSHRQNDLALQYYDRLMTSTNRKIASAIEHRKPILLSQGGTFSDDDLDDYLGNFQDINQLLNRDLMDPLLTCSNFYDITEKTWNSKYIQEYLAAVRKENSSFFLGLDELYSYIKTCEF